MDENKLAVISTPFEMYGKEVLTLAMNWNGTYSQVEFLKELCLDDDKLVDHGAMLKRLNRIPAMISFYGVLCDQASAELKDVEDAFDMWFAEVSDKVNSAKIEEIQKKDLPASMKKPPTQAEIKGMVMLAYKDTWESHQAKIRAGKEKQSMLKNILRGLETGANLIQSSNKLLILLWEKGVEGFADIRRK